MTSNYQAPHKMLIFDFFAGTGSSTQAFKDAGHTVITFELEKSFDVTEHANIMDLTADYLLTKYGQPDFVWASPPCTKFSVASIGKHWIKGGFDPEPRTKEAEEAQVLVAYTLALIKALQPKKGYLIENPVGMLRKLPVLREERRRTVTYCQYGDTRMKPTDLWGELDWEPLPMCRPGSRCHEAAPRGSRTGTQGLKNDKYRSMVPYKLGQEIMETITKEAK